MFVWDDAYPGQRDGSWIFTATLRCIAFSRHLSHEERFFSHFLPAALSLLVLAFGAIALTGLYGVLPPSHASPHWRSMAWCCCRWAAW